MEKKRIGQCNWWRESFTNLRSLSLLLLLAVNGVLSTHSDRDSPPPTIIPKGTDYTARLNENVRLTCMATEPIYWRFHKVVYDFEIRTSYNGASKYTHESVLDLNRVDFTYVDHYYCVKNASEPNANIETLLRRKQAAQIYVFVEDHRHPLVRASVPILEGNQFEELLIPCKPTSKNFEVQLFKEGNVRHPIHAPFSPSEGFRLRLNNITDAGQYACHVKSDVAEKFDTYFTVSVMAARSNILSEPTITSKIKDFGIENGQLELECAVKVASMVNRLEMKWELPNDNIAEKENRVRIIPPILQRLENAPEAFEAIGKLVVNHWDEGKDAGSYQCLLNDVNRIKLATLNVKQIFESQKPQLNLSDVFYNVGERVSVNCDIAGYPESTVLWSFTPCENVDLIILCDESKRVTFNDKKVRTNQRTRSTQRSILNFSPSGMGVIVCEATNALGKTEARADVIVNDMNGGFTIWNENEMPIVAGDDVSIVCGASAFKYTDMNWYKADILVTNSSNTQVVPKYKPYSQEKQIHWNSIEKEAAGQYVCRVKIVNSDSYVDRSWELQVIEPTLPSIVSSNLVADQTQKYFLNDHAKLLCKFSGIPNPQIKWFKDNHEIVPIANSKHLTFLEDKSILSIHLNADDEGIYRCAAENRAGQVSREVKLIIENASKSAAYKLTPLAIAAIPLSGICIVCLVSRYRR